MVVLQALASNQINKILKSWDKISDKEGLLEKIQSDEVLAVFKHSPRCPISMAAKLRIEDADKLPSEISSWIIVDVLEERPTSQWLAEYTHVEHESPQLLIFKNKKCIYHASHLDIKPDLIPVS